MLEQKVLLTKYQGTVALMGCCCCSLQPAVAPNAEDQEALLTVRGIWSIVQPNLSQQRDSKQTQQIWDEIYPLLPELLPGLSLTGKSLGVLACWHIWILCCVCASALQLASLI